MRLNLNNRQSAYIRLLWSVKLAVVLGMWCRPVAAQTEVFGAARDAARAAIIYPVVFDPLLIEPLTPGPEAVVDIHGSDVAGTAHIAVRNGDDSYGILASAPLSTADPSTSVDPRGMRRHASLGFHLTNIIWHPRTRNGETVAPWVLFIQGDYRFNRAEYEFADAKTLQRQTDTRLNDTASMLFGAQLFSSPRRLGYFIGFSYTYSAVFDQSGGLASNGLPAEGPTKVRGNLLRVEVRHPLTRRLGVNPSVTYERNSGVTTVDVTGYARMHHAYVGARAGNESTHAGRGGFFATVFVGWTKWDR
jgi:hypothetical protein